MGTRWRKAFCTSVQRDTSPTHDDQKKKSATTSSSSSASTPTLRCRTNLSPSPSPSPSPRPKPSTYSPRSPSRLTLLKLRLYKSCCGVCFKSTKTSQATAVLTAECSHVFHFSCIASHVSLRGALVCPVCNANWGPVPLLSDHLRRPPTTQTHERTNGAYDDDEPLVTPRCNGVVPEKEESKCQNSGESNDGGLFSTVGTIKSVGGVETIVTSGALPLSTGRTHNKYVIALKIKAPSVPSPAPTSTARHAGRAPIDLVAVLDVGGGMTGEKLLMLKRAMRLVISSLVPADRLAVVGASSTAKRLLPLTRMTNKGHRSARRIVEGLALGRGSSVSDALRKATRVLEDRRERNTVATIMLLSDGKKQPPPERPRNRPPSFPAPSATRFAHVEIPVDEEEKEKEQPAGDAFARCVGGLLSVVAQDVRLRLAFPPAEVTTVYACGAQPAVLGFAGGCIRLGDLYAEEERELLVEVSAPAELHRGSLELRCSYREPGAKDATCIEGNVPVSLPSNNQSSSSPSASMECLKNLYVTTRATVEARRLMELGEYRTAMRLLSSAESLVMQSSSLTAKESMVVLEGMAAEVRGRREERRKMGPREPLTPSSRRFGLAAVVEGEEEVLTPTSAWRAAEKLAKAAIVRKSMSRVGELHGFENARF